MEPPPPKLKVNMSTYRRLKIEHKINETNLKQNHLLNLQFYKYREEMFHRKIQSYIAYQPRLIAQMKTHYDPSSKQISTHHPNILHRTNEIFRSQQILNERQAILLKQFEELKHTINDPNATYSTLAALSRALLYTDSETK